MKQNLKDLGVFLSSDLTFKFHVEKMVMAASKLSGWGLRTFSRRNVGTMKAIWKLLVQPKLDYCSQFWSPSDQDSINRLESVQRHFLSCVIGDQVQNLDYWTKLKSLKLLSQERRRERYVIIFLWKMSQGLVSGYDMEYTSVYSRRGRTALPRNVVHSSPASVRRARESSVGVKGANLFNLIPNYIRNINSDNVDTFKANLDKFLETVPDQPTIAGQGRAADTNSLLHQIPLHL